MSAVEDLRARAEVGLQPRPPADGSQPLASLLEQLDVGVAEAVDRLLRIADREQVLVGDRLDQLELDTVGVLQLVDHDPLKALRVALAQLVACQKQLAGHQLEVLEVDARELALAVGISLAECGQQRVELIAHRRRGARRAIGPVTPERRRVRRARVSA